MRTFAEELIVVIALALGVSAIALPIPSTKLTPAELTALAAEKLARQNPPEKILTDEERKKVLAAQKDLTTELISLGYDPKSAVDAASKSLGKLAAVRDPCNDKTDPRAYLIPNKDDYFKVWGLKKEEAVCNKGADTLDLLLANRSELLKEVAQKPDDKPTNPGGLGEKDPKGGTPEGDKANVPAIATTAPIVTKGSSTQTPPTVNAGAGRGLPSAPQLGPLMGTASRGSALMGGYSGHKGDRFASPSSTRPEPAQNQNLEIVRQALQQKILQREITPAVADTLLSKISPALQKEPDLVAALQSADWDSPAPRPATPPSAGKSGGPPKGVSSSLAKEQPAKPESEPATDAKQPDSVWVLNGANNSLGLSELKKEQLGDSLASSIANAIAQKGAPLPSEDAPIIDGLSDDNSYPASGTGGATSSGLVENTPSPSTAEKQLSGKKQAVDQILGGASFKRIVERIRLAIHGDARKPASADQTAFDHFQQIESVTLAGLGSSAQSTGSPKLNPWVPVFFFVTPFTLTIVGFALWRWRQRRRA